MKKTSFFVFIFLSFILFCQTAYAQNLYVYLMEADIVSQQEIDGVKVVTTIHHSYSDVIQKESREEMESWIKKAIKKRFPKEKGFINQHFKFYFFIRDIKKKTAKPKIFV